MKQAMLILMVVAYVFGVHESEARADTLRGKVQVVGACSQFFHGGRQVQSIDATRLCDVQIDGLLETLEYPKVPANRRVIIVVSRRLTASVRRDDRTPRSTIKTRYVRRVPSFDSLVFQLPIRGMRGRARSTIRAFVSGSIAASEPADPSLCSEIADEFVRESQLIRSCVSDQECGLELIGTSCGCTREQVARKDADPRVLYQIIDRAQGVGCAEALPISSTCDCPEVSGFACVAGMCQRRFK